MNLFPKKLSDKIALRKQQNALRTLGNKSQLIDFSSNDYLGFSQSSFIFKATHALLMEKNILSNGATGSRLISGNHDLYQETEALISKFHQSECALIYNSGYDANVGFFSAVPQRNEVILYDELCHASIRDGIGLSHAKAFKFAHNDPEDLERLIYKESTSTIYIVTESIFSMDGDQAPLEEIVRLTEKHSCYLVVDEAHALGVFGTKGEGVLQHLQLENKIFARIMTFGKGLGCHGAAILGSLELKEYLINFSRSFIYTTALSPHAVATILVAYQHLEVQQKTIEQLKERIICFNQEKKLLGLDPLFVRSKSAIQSAIIPGNDTVKRIAQLLQEKGYEVKAILSPTVPEGQERLRFCLHAYNTVNEIQDLLLLLRNFVFHENREHF